MTFSIIGSIFSRKASRAKETEITNLEKAAWEAFKNKQADAFKRLLSKRYCGVYAEGIKTADAEAADMAKFDLRDYSLGDMKVTFPSIGVAVVTYKRPRSKPPSQARTSLVHTIAQVF